MVPLWTPWGDPLIRVMGPNLEKTLISLKLIELKSRDVKFVFLPNSNYICKIRFIRTSFRRMIEWVCVDWLYTYSILYNMAFMWWCSILGPGRISLLLTACFITFNVHKALQQKQHRCIIYHMHCRSLLSENSGQISIRDSNTKCMQIEFEFKF